ncbi:hypothetical protein QBC47DRAFT_323971 [Echria macrotheca]|uniref:CAP-Gly domain-containing protein n=1 Tax=Echria macrotheca TaxID=438768 RepID=A0AAJ0BG12_9PEZI|nr:hypothetical protein QBC47DRAFT_323971 [Echria macrotheca]
MSEPKVFIGQRRSYDGALCTVRYTGEVAGTSGSWLGVEWDDGSRGKHDGQHNGVRYFSCKSKSPTAASFVRPTRAVDVPQTFVSALQLKYASDHPDAAPDAARPVVPHRQIVISGKVAEEVGFDKIRRKQAQLADLKNVFLDGARVAYASPPAGSGVEEQSIRQACPKVVELDLSRNLFHRFGTVVDICSELGALQLLRVKGNRFQDIFGDEKLESAESVFRGVRELALDETLLEWDEICHIAARFLALTSLFSSANQLSSLSSIPSVPFTSTLVSVHMEFNEFTSLADIAPLAAISTLRNLHFKGNKISSISSGSVMPVFSTNLQYLDVSYNQVSSWSFIDALPSVFPGLASLRFAHNPIYDNPELDGQEATAPLSSATNTATNTEEAYMLLVARLPPSVKTINFSTVTAADRSNAEMFYLSRIARQLAAVPESAEQDVLKRHRRFAELCEVYGEPVVVRRLEVNPNFLEARLISVEFHITGKGGNVITKKARIPKAFDIYAVKGIVGKLFGLSPLGLKLVWETGEWDPVGGFDEGGGDDSEEEELLEEEWERRDEGDVFGQPGTETKKGVGRWVKRETELRDGPRQFGYCVDGMDVKIRVEAAAN